MRSSDSGAQPAPAAPFGAPITADGMGDTQIYTPRGISIPPLVLFWLVDEQSDKPTRHSERSPPDMCSPAICRTCNKITYTGCGMHVQQVLAMFPKENHCDCRH